MRPTQLSCVLVITCVVLLAIVPSTLAASGDNTGGFDWMHKFTKTVFGNNMTRDGVRTAAAQNHLKHKAALAAGKIPGTDPKPETTFTAVCVALVVMLVFGLVVVRKCMSSLSDVAQEDEEEARAKYGASGESYGARKERERNEEEERKRDNTASRTKSKKTSSREPAPAHYGTL
jgi:hypothetical protein